MRKPPRVLLPSEATALLKQPRLSSVTGLRDRAMLEVMLHCGLRVSEVVGVSIGQYRTTYLEIRDAKGGTHRNVPVPERVREVLNRWLLWTGRVSHHRDPLFCVVANRTGLCEAQVGDPLTIRSVQRMVSRRARYAGIDWAVTPHTLRHTYATELHRAGVPIRQVQDLLGHADISTTMIYTHVNAEDLSLSVERVFGKDAA